MMFSAQRVRAKARAAIKKREDDIEQDEIESGELNLIPYLDMVTNLMLFLLASVSAGLILVQIDSTLPDKKVDSASAQNPIRIGLSCQVRCTESIDRRARYPDRSLRLCARSVAASLRPCARSVAESLSVLARSVMCDILPRNPSALSRSVSVPWY